MSAGPFSLEQALVIWAHYVPNMPKQKRDPKTGAYLPGNPNAPWEIAYYVHQDDPQKFRELQKEQLLRALRDRDAMAEGEHAPIDRTDKMEFIHPDRWSVLDIDLKVEEARGKGLCYVNLRFWPRDSWERHVGKGARRRGAPSQRGKIRGEWDKMQSNKSYDLSNLSATIKILQDRLTALFPDIKRGFGGDTIKAVIFDEYKALKNNKK